MDPDDVIRAKGADFMRGQIDQARPLVDLLWMREFEKEKLDTPERRAGFEARLMGAVAEIKNPGVRKAYERELRDRLYQTSRGSRPAGPDRLGPQMGKRGESPGPRGERGLRLVVRAIESPAILEQVREAMAHAAFDDDVIAIRDAAFYVLDNTESLDRAAVAAHLRSLGRKRAVELLEIMPVGQPMDPRSNEGRVWLDALERFPVAATIAGEAKTTVRGDGDSEVLSAQHEARIRATVVGRRNASRPILDDAVASTADDGSQKLRNAVGNLGHAMERKRPED
jgi:DNA primase